MEIEDVNTSGPTKRSKNPAQWIANAAKVARSAGEAYTSREGKDFAAKVMKPGCGKSCKFACHVKVTEEDRQKVRDAYYKRPSQELKWGFIRLNVKERSPQKVKDKDNPTRKTSRQYYFTLKGKEVRVCQSMFLNTLVISDKVVRTACSKLSDGGKYSPDKRGGRKGNLKSEAVVKSISDHIASFPRVASHYCRANSSCQYLEAKVDSVANMHRLYAEWMREHKPEQKQATLRQYTDHFNTLNLKFHKPRKDQCDICFAWKINSVEKSEEEQKKYEFHILQKDLAQALKKKDREEVAPSQPNTSVCAFDLQKVLLVPHCEASAVYYKRKITVYNFTIYDMGRHEGFCYVWHEGIGKKGANEMASYVFSFIEKRAQQGVTSFIFYSDNCSGQNKNRFLYAMYLLASAKFNVKILHRYLVAGHTQNEADGMHALIERKSKKEDIYTPEQWCKIMEGAKVRGKPYEVKRIQQQDLLDFHPLVEKNMSWPSTVKWLEISELEVNSGNLWHLNIKYDFSDFEAITVNTKRQRAGHPLCLKNYKPPQAYRAPLPVTKLKKKDLDEMCDRSKVIPAEYVPFFKSFAVQGQDEVEEGEVVDDFYEG